MRLLLAAMLFGPGLQAEIIDRIAVSIGNRIMTESMIIQQIRLAAFLDNREPDFSVQSKRQAAETLVSQMLLIQEMDDTRFTVPTMNEVIAQLKENVMPRVAGEQAFQEELAKAKLTEDELRRFMQQMIRAEQFAELRFQRGQQVSSDEIAEYYSKEFRNQWTKDNPGKPLPPLDEVSEDIEWWILSAKTDTATEEWLAQAKASVKIRYREEVFQ